MTAVQAVALITVAIAGGLVVLVPDPVRSTLVLGVYGLALTFMFFALQAPDVALSEIVVSTVGLPVIVFAALRKIHSQQSSAKDEEDS